MKVDQEMLIKYLLGETTTMENAMITNLLEEDLTLQKEYQELAKIWSELESLPDELPSQKMEHRFTHWLDSMSEVPASRKSSRVMWLRSGRWAAAAAVVLLAGFFVFHQSKSTPVSESRSTVTGIEWVSSPSTTERIQGIYHATMKEHDPAIVQILLKLLREDESDNVRLTAVEALQTFPLTDDIKIGLIQALEKEEKPVVQIALISALVGLSDHDAKPQLEALIGNEDVEKTVKDEAQLGLLRL
ncbi:MAG: HEAT repeat domain-containing protein [Saprospiraceae bacterium]|nr:HEAT repeat domain-containing protein [Saprospiraceae bacterium]